MPRPGHVGAAVTAVLGVPLVCTSPAVVAAGLLMHMQPDRLVAVQLGFLQELGVEEPILAAYLKLDNKL
jgi:hypothetical protein